MEFELQVWPQTVESGGSGEEGDTVWQGAGDTGGVTRGDENAHACMPG